VAYQWRCEWPKAKTRLGSRKLNTQMRRPWLQDAYYTEATDESFLKRSVAVLRVEHGG